MHQKLAFSVYGENAIILVQNAIVILLIYYYDKSVSFGEKIVFMLFMGAYLTWLIMDVNVPEEVWPTLSGCTVLLNIASRVPQIITNFQNKSTGVLAFFTFLLAWVGGLVRLATVCIESDDLFFKCQFIISFLLNTAIIV